MMGNMKHIDTVRGRGGKGKKQPRPLLVAPKSEYCHALKKLHSIILRFEAGSKIHEICEVRFYQIPNPKSQI